MTENGPVVDRILSISGRQFPQKTQLMLYPVPLPGYVGVKLKLPKARRFEDLGYIEIKNNTLYVPLRVAFMAYAREDEPLVKKLYQSFLNNAILPWMDTKDLMGGQAWRVFRDKALREADHCVLFLSSHSVRKIGEFQREIRLAVDEAQRRPEESNYLIPVKLDDCNPPDIVRDHHWVELYGADGMRKLVQSVRSGK